MRRFPSRPLHSRSTFFAYLCVVGILACDSDTIPVVSSEQELSSRFTCLIPSSEILDGGVGRDGIPALDFPASVTADSASGFMHDSMRVIGVELDGTARAYPLFILWWHEVVNDTLGGQPVLVSYCPLTGSGLAFDPVVDGVARRFGVSGLLYENNLIMFDRDTESFWVQLLLVGQCGPKRGTPLWRIPVIETTWGHWKSLHPNTTVTSIETGFERPYDKYPFGNYRDLDNESTLLPSAPWNPARPAKELTLGVNVGLSAKAYPFGVLEALGPVAVVNDEVGPRPILVTWLGSARTARAFGRRVDGRDLTFEVADLEKVTFRDRETGSFWNARGEAVSGELRGQLLEPVTDAWTMFWFSWSVFNSGTSIFSP